MSSHARIKPVAFVIQGQSDGPRCGILNKGNVQISTPSYLAVSSRGVVPHLSQDTLEKHVSLPGVYVALEDFIEHSPGQEADLSILSVSQKWDEQPLRKFLALRNDSLLCFGARRLPAVSTTIGNSSRAIGIYTLKGMQSLPVSQFGKVAFESQPDVVVGLADIAFSSTHGRRRREKMASNTEQLMTDLIEILQKESATTDPGLAQLVLAPILPIEYTEQRWYIEMLRDELLSQMDGLAIYSADILPELPAHFNHMPRFSFSDVPGPHEMLKEISLGIDLLAIPFVNAASDAGIALQFEFPVAGGHNSNKTYPLGSNLWDEKFAKDLEPVSNSCHCYTCKNHHRAFVHHLLSVREMLAWSLLQIHNFNVINDFFTSIRNSITRGTFEDDITAFGSKYEKELPIKTGEGPRVRGYQYRPEGPGEPKRNPPGFTPRMSRMAQQADSPSPMNTPELEMTADDLEQLGLGEKERQ